MKINYGLTGQERKPLVAAISKELNAPAKYLKMPSMAFEIGEYTVTKAGVLEGPDNRELVADLRGAHGFIPVSEEYDDCPDIDQHHPGQYANASVPTTDVMLRQAEAWMEGQPEFEDLGLTEREELGLGRERRDLWGEDGMQASDVPEPEDECTDDYVDGNTPDGIEADEQTVNADERVDIDDQSGKAESDRLVIEMPLDGFTPEKLDNLAKLVNAKAPLLKAALGSDDLPIQQTENTLRFPWFGENLDADHVKAYATLIAKICAAAKGKTRVTAKERDVGGLTSPKYTMRCFLLSLGFIGVVYKTSRKILLSKLDGNGSFLTPEAAEAAKERNKEKRRDSIATAGAEAEAETDVEAVMESTPAAESEATMTTEEEAETGTEALADAEN